MSHFIFSCDGHILEPSDIFSAGLPASMRERAIVSERKDGYHVIRAGEQIIHRVRLVGDKDTARRDTLGIRDLAGRRKDMEHDGIDAELIFPSLGMWTFAIADPEAEQGMAEIYNDWVHGFFKDYPETFVAAGVLPVRDLGNTLAEIRRAVGMGFTTLMLPSTSPNGVPDYNDAAWDPVFELAGELGAVFALHTGTGVDGGPVQERGPGGATINYTRQMMDAIKSTMYLVAGGVLDRYPKSKVAFIESGASWLGAVAERMDEVDTAHAAFVRPKLSRKPSQIIRDQVKASFQHDRECIMGRAVTGHQAVMWAADYPHSEGTFPHSQQVIEGLFEGLDVTEDEKADILGRTAARFFGLKRPEYQRTAA